MKIAVWLSSQLRRAKIIKGDGKATVRVGGHPHLLRVL